MARWPRQRRVTDPVFGFEVPQSCGEIGSDTLWPRDAWSDENAYDMSARRFGGLVSAKLQI